MAVTLNLCGCWSRREPEFVHIRRFRVRYWRKYRLPGHFPTAMVSRASSSLAFFAEFIEPDSEGQTKVTVPWMPWERPIITVSLCSGSLFYGHQG